MKRLFLTLLLLASSYALSWDNDTLDQAWRVDDISALEVFKANSDFEQQYVQYRIGMIALRMDDKKKAKKALDSVIDFYEDNYKTADEAALYSAALGLSIAVRPWKAISISKKAEAALDYAKAQSTNHAPTLMVEGIAQFNTPGFMGGDKALAVKTFDQAIALYEQEESWGFEDALLWKIKALAETDQPAEATANQTTALEKFPDYVELTELEL